MRVHYHFRRCYAHENSFAISRDEQYREILAKASAWGRLAKPGWRPFPALAAQRREAGILRVFRTSRVWLVARFGSARTAGSGAALLIVMLAALFVAALVRYPASHAICLESPAAVSLDAPLLRETVRQLEDLSTRRSSVSAKAEAQSLTKQLLRGPQSADPQRRP